MRILFFDLEYYVPLKDRNNYSPSGMTFTPTNNEHKILGGVFMTYYPMLDKCENPISLWEWNTKSEAHLLQEIFNVFQTNWKGIENNKKVASLMVGGIGISHSDMPSLMHKMLVNKIADPKRLFDLLYGCRQIDLTTASFAQFNFNHKYFSYPKSKSHLYQKYMLDKSVESGKSVWEKYEQRDFSAIESRTIGEVNDILLIYKAIVENKNKTDSDLRKLKKLLSE